MLSNTIHENQSERMTVQELNQDQIQRAVRTLIFKIELQGTRKEYTFPGNSVPIELFDRQRKPHSCLLKLENVVKADGNLDISLCVYRDDKRTILPFIMRNYRFNGPAISKKGEHGIRYLSSITINDPSFKRVGIGSGMQEECEDVVIKIAQIFSSQRPIDLIQFMMQDDSNPRQWTSRRAEKLGFRSIGMYGGYPAFQKDVYLNEWEKQPIVNTRSETKNTFFHQLMKIARIR